MTTREAERPPIRRGMPFRHKLLLLAAFEIVVAGFAQARMHPYRPGITVELPTHPGHVIV